MSRSGRFGLTFRLTWAMIATTQVLGFLLGFFAVFPLFEYGVALVAFLGGWVGSTLYLLAKSSPIDAMGTGFQVLAVAVFVTPFKQFLPMLGSGSEVGGAAGALLITEGAQGLLTWVTVCTLVAVGMLAIGRYCNRVTERVQREKLRAGYRAYEF